MRPQGRAVTRCALVVASALLTLQSCKNNQTAETRTPENPEQQRPVFGAGREVVPSETRARALTEDREERPDKIAARRGNRKDGAESPARLTEPPHKRGGSVDPLAAGRAPGQPTSERFLHYEPPGSPVGDPGELASSAPVSTSGLQEVIRRWADTLLAGDLDAHMSLYASTLEHFNGSTNVANDTVREFKRRLISSLKGARRFEIYDMRIKPLPDGTVRADFRVEFDGGARSYGLDLRRVSGRWKIYGEEAGVQGISTSRRMESK